MAGVVPRKRYSVDDHKQKRGSDVVESRYVKAWYIMFMVTGYVCPFFLDSILTYYAAYKQVP